MKATPLVINQAFNNGGDNRSQFLVTGTGGVTVAAGGSFTYLGDGLLGTTAFSVGGASTITHTGGTLTQDGGGAGCLIGHNAVGTYNISGGNLYVVPGAPTLTIRHSGGSDGSSLNISGTGRVDVEAGVNLVVNAGGTLNVTGGGLLVWHDRTVAETAGFTGTVNAAITQVGADVHFTDPAPPVPRVALSNSSVAPNAPPGSVVGNLSAAAVATTTGWSFALAAGGDNDNFEITDVDVPTGTAILRTKVWLNAADFPYSISVTGTHPTDGDSPLTTGHSISGAGGTSYVAFVASAGVAAGVAPVGGRLVATLDARDSDGTQITAPNFSLVPGYGRTDLFEVSGNELRLIAGEDAGAAPTLHYVAIQAAGTANGYIIVEIEVGSAATVIRIR